jgi:hypothetical protein
MADISAVKFITSRGPNCRQFKTFLDEIETEYGDKQYYSEVRWLSETKIPQHLYITQDY